jgi:hypothetical protein
VAATVAPNLMLRAVADDFFDKLEAIPAQNIVLDFKGVQSISRSFAHQYILRRMKSSKNVEEANVVENVQHMFKIVERQVAGGETPSVALKCSSVLTA